MYRERMKMAWYVKEEMQMIFETENGSLYMVDAEKRIIRGGMLAEPLTYEQGSAMIGMRAVFFLNDGALFQTDTVKRYISVTSL